MAKRRGRVGTQITIQGTLSGGVTFGKYGKGTTKTRKENTTTMAKNHQQKFTESAEDDLRGGQGENGTGFPWHLWLFTTCGLLPQFPISEHLFLVLGISFQVRPWEKAQSAEG